MALDDEKYDHLQELGGSDYEIKDGEPNIKGWTVRNEYGKKIGEVDELLFDAHALKVRYLIVDIDDNELDIKDGKKVLIPIGVAELHGSDVEYDHDDAVGEDDHLDERVRENEGIEDEAYPETTTVAEDDEDELDHEPHKGVYNAKDNDDEDVVIAPVSLEQLNELPAYKKDGVTPEMEATVRHIFEGTVAAEALAAEPYDKNQFYIHDHFNEDKFYGRDLGEDTTKLPVIEENLLVGKQEVETGGARITSRIVERPVQENINLREEHVTVERTQVNRPVSEADLNAFKEEEFEMTEHAEVPVVSKEARVVEEVSLNKEVEEKEETIKDTLRNTEVVTERIDPEKKDTF